jgi:ankyrin repeat protein
MEEFIGLVFDELPAKKEIKDELKQELLNDFIALSQRQKVLLSRTDLSINEFLEFLEVQKSLQEVNVIIQSETSPREKLSQFIDFLDNRWKRINKTSLNYCYAPTLPITTFCHNLAKMLALNQSDKDASAYKFLMPTILNVTAKNPYTFEVEKLDDLPLGKFILDADQVCPIPFYILSSYFSFKKEKYTADHIQSALFNPYKKSELNKDELILLVNASKEAIELNNTCNACLSAPSNAPIYEALYNLRDGLDRGSIKGAGSEGIAAAVAHEAVKKFNYFLSMLPNDTKEKLLNLKSNDGMKFREILELLNRKDTSNPLDQKYCVELNQKKINDILMNPNNHNFLMPKDKSLSLLLSEQQFKNSLGSFNECAFSSKPFSLSSAPYQHSPQQILLISKQIFELYENDSSFFKNDNIMRPALAFLMNQPYLITDAISGNYSKIVRKLLQENPNLINIQDQNGDNLFAKAVREKKMECIAVMIELHNMHQITLTNQECYRALSLAIEKNDLKIARQLIHFFPEMLEFHKNHQITIADQNLPQLLSLSIEENAWESAEKLIGALDDGANIAIMQTIAVENIEIFNKLLKQNPQLCNIQNQNGDTPLMVALSQEKTTYANAISAVKNLDVNLKNKDGQNALHIAIRQNYNEIALELITLGADVNAIDIHGNTTALYAASAGNEEILAKLLKKYPQLFHISNHNGDTPLTQAVRSKHDECVQMMLYYYKENKIKLSNQDLNTALTLAMNNDSPKIVESLLIIGGVTLDVANKNQQTTNENQNKLDEFGPAPVFDFGGGNSISGDTVNAGEFGPPISFDFSNNVPISTNEPFNLMNVLTSIGEELIGLSEKKSKAKSAAERFTEQNSDDPNKLIEKIKELAAEGKPLSYITETEIHSGNKLSFFNSPVSKGYENETLNYICEKLASQRFDLKPG